MEQKKFPLNTVLVVIFGRDLEDITIEMIAELLKFISGKENIPIDEFMMGIEECREVLLEQFPLFDTAEAKKEWYELLQNVDDAHRRSKYNHMDYLVRRWIEKQAERYGKELEVKRPPKEYWCDVSRIINKDRKRKEDLLKGFRNKESYK